MTEMFVIQTRATASTGRIIRHVYGPWTTRARANAALKRFRVTQVELYGEDAVKTVEMHVTKIITMGDKT